MTNGDPRTDRNAPQREPDGSVDGYYFWLGDDADYTYDNSDMGDDEEATQRAFEFGDGED